MTLHQRAEIGFPVVISTHKMDGPTTLQSIINTKLSQHRFWPSHENLLIKMIQIQSTLGFATMGLAANLALATSIPMTDLRQYINSDLVFSDLKLQLLYGK